MCPGTLAIIAMGASAAGSLYGGISKAESASYQAQVAANNAQIERQNAAYSASAAAANTEKAGLEARAKLANVRAAGAANNLDVNSGSAADVQTSQRILGGLDTATVANRGAQQVYGYQSEAVGYEAQAKADKAQIIPDIIGGGLGAVGDIAKGLSGIPSPGGGGGSGGGPTASPSLIESSASVPSDYSWMQTFDTSGVSTDVPEFG